MSRRETQKIMIPKPDNSELTNALTMIRNAALVDKVVLNKPVLSYFKLRFPLLRAEHPKAPIRQLVAAILTEFPASTEGLAIAETLAGAFVDSYKTTVRSWLEAAVKESVLPPHLVDSVFAAVCDARMVAMNARMGCSHETGHPYIVTIADAMVQARELAREDVNLLLPKLVEGMRDRE